MILSVGYLPPKAWHLALIGLHTHTHTKQLKLRPGLTKNGPGFSLVRNCSCLSQDPGSEYSHITLKERSVLQSLTMTDLFGTCSGSSGWGDSGNPNNLTEHRAWSREHPYPPRVCYGPSWNALKHTGDPGLLLLPLDPGLPLLDQACHWWPGGPRPCTGPSEKRDRSKR